MSLNKNAMKYVPTSAKDGSIVSMCLAANITDVEILGSGGIIDSLYNPNKSFVGVVAYAPTEIPNAGLYSLYNPQDMIRIRQEEQQKAANIGSYNSVFLLNHNNEEEEVVESIINDFVGLIKAYKPEIIYTFSPFDLDPAKIEIMKCVIIALSRIVDDYRPKAVYGVYTEGSLSFVPLTQLVDLGIETKIGFAYSLLNVYDSASEALEALDPATDAIDLTKISNLDELKVLVEEILEGYKQEVLSQL